MLANLKRFTTLWIYTILKLDMFIKVFQQVSLPYGFTLFSNNYEKMHGIH